MRECLRSHGQHLMISFVRIDYLFILFTLFNEVRELLEVEEPVADTLCILLLVDEVVRLDLLVLHLLFLVLAHHLREGAIKFSDIIWEQLTVTKYLQQ